MLRILPYKMSSESARRLAESLDVLRIHPTRGTYRRKKSHILINWGCSHTPYEDSFRPGDFNHPVSVSAAADKLVTFELLSLKSIPVPAWTKDIEVAKAWQSKVYGRDSACGHGGEGIHVYNPGEELGHHLFYTKGVKNAIEYRIHIADGRVLDITQKKKKNGHESLVNGVRNHENGWVFCRNNIIKPHDTLVQTATDAVRGLDLCFGAVDICTSSAGQVTVFEVNTAPGIEGTTLDRYVSFFKEYGHDRF